MQCWRRAWAPAASAYSRIWRVVRGSTMVTPTQRSQQRCREAGPSCRALPGRRLGLHLCKDDSAEALTVIAP